MKRSGKLSLSLRSACACALLLVACNSATPLPKTDARVVIDVPANADKNLSNQINRLAAEGKFSQLAHLIKGLPEDDETKALSASINKYQEHAKARNKAKQDAYNKALEEAAEAQKEGKIEDAMVKVIKAHSLAEHPAKLLNKPEVASLIKQVSDKANAAKKGDKIVDAASLYRLLDLLYEDSRKYRDQYREVATQVRVLQLYNPKLHRTLYKERAQRLGDKDLLKLFEEAEKQEVEDWTVKLADIDNSMLGQTLRYATRYHIDKGGYAKLVKGAAQGLKTMIRTEGIQGVFPGLADKAKYATLNNKIDAVVKDVSRQGRVLTRGAAATILADLIVTNQRSVNLPESVIVYELTSGATESLDTFSSVIWPNDLRQFERSINGKFVGIGVQIQKIDGKLTVVTPLENTPAIKAGLKAKDVIARVNGVATVAWTIEHAVREITGPEDTKVTLTILREVDGKNTTFDVTLIRKPIKLESIKGVAHRDAGGWDYWVDKKAGIGYVRMTGFLRQTADDLDKAVKQMTNEGQLKGIVLDLRFNPGGLLSTAVKVVNRFISRGMIVTTVDANNNTTSSYRASFNDTYSSDIKLVVLINQGSASASEIVSGALKDYGRAVIVGENTYGKGSVQDIFSIAGGNAAFKCTTQYYKLPKGQIIHRKDDSKTWGIQPDLEVKMTNKEVADWLEARRDADIIIAKEDRDPKNPQTNPHDILKKGMDPQLEAAVLLLKAQLYSSRVELAKKVE